jgi:hypothetical protein
MAPRHDRVRRSVGVAAVAVAALSAAAWLDVSAHVSVVVIVLAFSVIAGGWAILVVSGERSASADLEEGGERTNDLVERGMRDLAGYLDRHAAFAAYLEHHGKQRPPVDVRVDADC